MKIILILLALGLQISCTENISKRPNVANSLGAENAGSSTPQTGDVKDEQPATEFVHFEAPCAKCHEKDRPALPHPAAEECSSCHSFPDFAAVQIAAFSHMPKPETCEGCHTRPKTVGARAYPNQGPPVNFDPNVPTDGSGHYVGKDCASCHQTPAEGQEKFVFTHSQPNPQACLPCHYNNGRGEHQNDNDVMLSGFGNCVNCHKNFDKLNNRNFGD